MDALTGDARELEHEGGEPRRGSWKLVAPLLLVTTFAIYGQVVTGLENYTAAADPWYVRWGVAIGAAAAIESIALFVQWHAHDALLLKASATAARLRRASYLIAASVATINYWHFSDNWQPTAAAVVFAVFSASGPWLWGLHTRRVQHLQLLREGQVDAAGAVFSAERWRAFPIRTWKARRWSIDYSITDPREAWERYRAASQTDAVGGGGAADLDDDLPDRRAAVDTTDLAAVIADLRSVSGRTGRTYSRDEIRQMYGIKSDRAMTARRMLAWADVPAAVGAGSAGSARAAR
jgi:hypothetical protein